jgi:cell division protein FtsB
MPSGKQIEKNGLDVGETMKGVTSNVEENRLDITDLHKRLLKLEKENQKLKKEINELKNK